MSHQFNDKNGKRGQTKVTLSMAEVYDIVRDRIEYMCVNQKSIDPDAVCQNVCVEIEKKMGIFPNIDSPKEQETSTDVNIPWETDIPVEQKTV